VAELDRILSSAAFANVERPGRFLRHVVETALRGESSLLKESVIGVEVFERTASWDPRLDPIVRQEAGRLRKRLTRYYSSEGAGSNLRIELPVGGYVPEFHSVSVPPEQKRRASRWWPVLLAAFACGGALAAFLFLRSHAKLISGGHRPSPEAEELCLRGAYYWQKRTPQSLNQAVDLFTQAMVRDPQYAPAYVGLAKCYLLLREFSAMPDAEAYPRARAAAQKALELDESSAEAHCSLAFISFWWNWNAAAADREFRRSLALDPNSGLAHHWYATFLGTRARRQEALQHIDLAQKLEPASTSILADKGLLLFSFGHRDDAVALLTQLQKADPAQQSSYRYLARIYVSEGRYSEYLDEFSRYAALSGDRVAQAVAAAAMKGYAKGGGERMLESTLETETAFYRKRQVPAYFLAQTCALLGRNAQAIAWLETASTEPGDAFLGYRTDEVFANLRSDAAYRNLDARFEPLIQEGRVSDR
jgi:hypothetical protein